eukprot:TRINITY_DN8207_c0_g1_i1.p1 TRINITY_DN8207_c0_g1~~TRINITY_DN8207_c0_g1_i1.p1  ORF type:complete len:301 (-),score=104.43 TRINITY_DN8207_c0_g1_i1:264-1166(-)
MGCGGSKDDKEKKGEGGDAPENKVENAGDDSKDKTSSPDQNKEPTQTEENNQPEDPPPEKWASPELKSMMFDYFSRYDLDGSGTINTSSELKQLCTNLVVKLELDMDVKTIDNHVNAAGDMSVLNWEFKPFMKWFMEAFKPPAHWQTGDVSSSDVDGPEGQLRSGTYNLEMADGVVMPFKIRYEDGARTKLFSRTASDGLHAAKSKGQDLKHHVPKDLHIISGTFDQEAKTCNFTKAYDVDCDPNTKEPVIEFEGIIVSETEITGTWKNTETDPAAVEMLAEMNLGSEGKFTMKKQPKLD